MSVIKEFFMVAWSYILTITISDVLDVAIIAYLIYRAIGFVRRTSSLKVFKGILLLIAVMWLSSLLNLSVVNYLLGATFELGILAVIVLFQPEIRRILERVGSSKFSSIFGRRVNLQQMELVISQVVMACADMAQTKTGVLIVFERNNDLNEYIKTGTILDAEPASELLKNIFFHNTPLHDGAVIIKNGRVSGAACMLPLSNNSNLSRELGMRHRAGIGISEATDAISVIVSEETGAISVAVGGMLKRQLKLETFENILRNELLEDDVRDKDRWAFLNKIKIRRNDNEKD